MRYSVRWVIDSKWRLYGQRDIKYLYCTVSMSQVIPAYHARHTLFLVDLLNELRVVLNMLSMVYNLLFDAFVDGHVWEQKKLQPELEY